MDTLRQELLQAQKTRSELLKWKLLIVAGVGGAALGFSGRGPGKSYLALAVLPLCCAYVDLLCWNLFRRIKSIGIFFEHVAHSSTDLRRYEIFFHKMGRHFGRGASLETWASLSVTVTISVAVWLVGTELSKSGSWEILLFPISAGVGVGLTVLFGIWSQLTVGKARSSAVEIATDVERTLKANDCATAVAANVEKRLREGASVDTIPAIAKRMLSENHCPVVKDIAVELGKEDMPRKARCAAAVAADVESVIRVRYCPVTNGKGTRTPACAVDDQAKAP
jgi:uncharacterized metal-binding protein